MAIQEDPSPSPSREDELRKLQDKLRMLQKYGTLTDEQIEDRLALERWKADAPERKRQMAAARLAEQARIDQETRAIARAELGKRIVVSLNRQRISALHPDGGVLCPECGADFAPATVAVLTIANLIRGGGDPENYVARLMSGYAELGAPIIHTSAPCPQCGVNTVFTVQLVI
ncbi:hypothetical protein ASZ90_016985 [hydrocarbon metagenome]|uniref:Uncharacterized protein n=1 Tax=hydrocarbon metagenome TaxID=938273 RepID=A0A0W8EAL1_9ZZZZ